MRRLLIAWSALLLVCAPVAAHATTRLAYRVPSRETGRVAIDTSGHHNNGRLYGGVGRRHGAYVFHPLSGNHRFDRIIAPNSRSLNPRLLPFTYRVRVKVPSPRGGEMAVVRHGDSDAPGGDYKMELQRSPRTHEVSAFCVIHDNDGHGVGYVRGRGGLRTLADDRWHTIACSRVAPQRVALTIDGDRVVRRTTGNLGRVKGNVPLMVGCQLLSDGRNFGEQFVGLLDDITITVHH